MQKVFDITLNGHRFLMELDDERFSHRLIAGAFLLYGRPYDDATTSKVVSILNQGDTFIDIGAHIGWYTLVATGCVGLSGRIVSIEPEMDNFIRLKRHLSMNKINGTVHCHRKVANAQDGMVPFHINLDNDGGHSLWPGGKYPFNEKTARNPQVVMVEGITIDTLCQEEGITHVDLIKIDTEGAEVEVLKGASNMLREHRVKHVIAEVNDFGLNEMGSCSSEMEDLMKSFGYHGTVLGEQEEGMIYNILFSLAG